MIHKIKTGRFIIGVSQNAVKGYQRMWEEDFYMLGEGYYPNDEAIAIADAVKSSDVNISAFSVKVLTEEPKECATKDSVCEAALDSIANLPSHANFSNRMIHCPNCQRWWRSGYYALNRWAGDQGAAFDWCEIK